MKKCLIYFCSALLVLQSSAALAFTDTGVEEEPLFFGQIVLNDTTTAHTCTIPAGGTMSCDSQITILQPGRYGVFQLSGYDPTVYIWASASNTSMSDNGGATNPLNIINFTFAPDIHDIATEQKPPGGMLMLYIGATLQTQAGQVYDVAPYHGTFDLQINY